MPVNRLVGDVQPPAARQPVQLGPRLLPREIPDGPVVIREVEMGTLAAGPC
jgi:hypothetical protein